MLVTLTEGAFGNQFRARIGRASNGSVSCYAEMTCDLGKNEQYAKNLPLDS